MHGESGVVLQKKVVEGVFLSSIHGEEGRGHTPACSLEKKNRGDIVARGERSECYICRTLAVFFWQDLGWMREREKIS